MKKNNINTYNMFIMGKRKGQSKFKALQMSKGVQVNNLLYATIFKSDKLEELKPMLNELATENKDWTFKIVKAGTSKILYQTKTNNR